MILDISNFLPWIIGFGVVIVACVILLIIIVKSDKHEKNSQEEVVANTPDNLKKAQKTENVKKDVNRQEKPAPQKVEKQASTKAEEPAPKKAEKPKATKSAPKTTAKKESNKAEAKVKQEEPKDTAEAKQASQKYMVVYDKENKDWVVKKTGAKKASKRCNTKKEALEVAEKLADNQDLNLSIKKKDGKFQKKY
ncbi:MAG: DUF2188 domain-containing protein [Clostridia bacterium]|nr:DUF2188 domain-containing protein [Clostridia bacterium]